MLKKKNIAMMTAAMTAASAVTPAFAATVNRAIVTDKDMADADQKQEVMDKVKGYLDTTYTTDKTKLVDEDKAGKTAYTVTINPTTTMAGLTTSHTVETYSEFEVIMSKMKKDEVGTITISDKGHRTVEGEIVDWDEYKFDDVARSSSATTTVGTVVAEKWADALNDNIIKVDGVRLTLSNTTLGTLVDTDGITKATIGESGVDINGNGTTGDTVFKYSANSPSKDFSKPIRDSKGFIVNFENAKEEIGVIERAALNRKNETISLKCTETPNADVERVTIDAAELMEEGRFTVKGNELLRTLEALEDETLTNSYGKTVKLVAAKQITSGGVVTAKEVVDAIGTDMYTVSTGAVTYVDSTTSKIKITITPELGYAYANGKKMNATNATIASGVNLDNTNVVIDTDAIAEITIEGTHADVKEIANAIDNGASVNTLAGMDRYKTAIQVSKQAYSTVGTVVLVSGEALVDGLSATPYAAQLNAPILLTESGSLNADTKAEILRLQADNVHIIGGTSAVSSDVVDELGKMGLNVERIAGDDRYETSLAVAKKLTSADTVYVAQGDAMADALSISVVAGQSERPILLTSKDSVSKDVITFLETKNTKDAFVIGGKDVISESVVEQLNKVIANDVKVLGGSDRYDTNAKVIEEFGANTEEVIVVNGDKGLVDALSAGAYAKTTSTATLVLAGNDLSASQKVELKAATKTTHNKVQIGYNVALNVIKSLNDLLK